MELTVVIPTFNQALDLRNLIEDLRNTTPEKCLPNRILIVNDGSTEEDVEYVAPLMTTSALPVECVDLENQVGYPSALKVGLSQVDTPYAIALHADIRLVDKIKFLDSKVPKVITDPIGLLSQYIAKSDPKIAAIAPYSLLKGQTHRIYGGLRMLAANDIPISKHRSLFFETLRKIPHQRWRPAHAVDHCCVAFKMDCYKPLPTDCRHFFFFDDWCTVMREAGYFIYLTSDTVVFHGPNADKPEGSLSIPTEQTYTEGLNRFRKKWIDSGLWDLNVIRYGAKIEEITSG